MRNVGRIVYLTSRASSRKGVNPLIEHTHHIESKGKIEFNMCYTLKLTKEEQWRKVPWNKFDQQIRKIQERIYDASIRNDSKSVRTLQKNTCRADLSQIYCSTTNKSGQSRKKDCRRRWDCFPNTYTAYRPC